MKAQIITAIGSALVLGLSLNAQSAVLAEFTFDGNSTASSDSSIFTSVTAWDISNLGTAAQITGDRTQTHANQNAGGISPSNTNPVGGQYAQFTITAQNLGASESIILDSFSFDYAVQNANAPTFQAGLYSDATGFTGLGDLLVLAGPLTGNSSTFASVNLTGLIDDLSNGESVNFRIYLADGSNNVSSRLHFLDNVTLNGSFNLVPEPSTLALLAIGFGAITFARRRK